MENPGTLKVGGHVRVADNTDENTSHPHGGKTGTINEMLGVRLTGPNWPPRALVKLDDGTGIAVISLKYLEPIP